MIVIFDLQWVDILSYLEKKIMIVSYLHGVIQSLLLVAPTATFNPPPIHRDVNFGVYVNNIVIWRNGYLCNSTRYRVHPSQRKTLDLNAITDAYKLVQLAILDVVFSKGQPDFFTVDIISANMEYYGTELASTRYARHAHQLSVSGNIVFGRSRSDYSCIYTPDADQTPWISAGPSRQAHCPLEYIKIRHPKDALYSTAYSRTIAYLALPTHPQHYTDHDDDGLFEYFNKTSSVTPPRVKFSVKEGVVVTRSVDVTEHVADEFRTSMSMDELIKRYTPIIEGSTTNLTLASITLKAVVYPPSRSGAGTRYFLDINFSDLALHDQIVRNLRNINVIRREESSFTSGLCGAHRRVVFEDEIVDATNYISDSDELDLADNYPTGYTETEDEGQDDDEQGANVTGDSDADDDQADHNDDDDDDHNTDDDDEETADFPDGLPGFVLRGPSGPLNPEQRRIAQITSDFVVPIARHFDAAVPPALQALMRAAAAETRLAEITETESIQLPPAYTLNEPPPPYSVEDPYPLR